MPDADRAALASRAGLPKTSPAPRMAWADITPAKQAQLAAAMESPAKPFKLDPDKQLMTGGFPDAPGRRRAEVAPAAAPPITITPATPIADQWNAASMPERARMLDGIGRAALADTHRDVPWQDLSPNLQASLLNKAGQPIPAAKAKPVTPQVPARQVAPGAAAAEKLGATELRAVVERVQQQDAEATEQAAAPTPEQQATDTLKAQRRAKADLRKRISVLESIKACMS
jgi:hypothetical protein